MWWRELNRFALGAVESGNQFRIERETERLNVKPCPAAPIQARTCQEAALCANFVGYTRFSCFLLNPLERRVIHRLRSPMTLFFFEPIGRPCFRGGITLIPACVPRR